MDKAKINNLEGVMTIEFWTKRKVLVTEKEQKELSLKTIKEKAGVSVAYLSQILTGKRDCPNNTFLKILTNAFDFHPVTAARILKEIQRDEKKIKAVSTICFL